MRKYYYLTFLMLCSQDASASWLDGDSADTGTIGHVLKVFGEQISSIDGLLRLICYLCALFFGVSGVMKIKNHMDDPGKVSIKEPLIRILVGAWFVALPTLIMIIINSTVGTNGNLDLKVDI